MVILGPKKVCGHLHLVSQTFDNTKIITVRNEVAKVKFLHLSVILFTEVVCLSACWESTPLGADTPQTRHPPHRSWHPLGADTSPDRVHHPGAGTPQEQTPSPHTRQPPGADTPPPDMATVADATHPTGMHSC